jgi:hypothetical protein
MARMHEAVSRELELIESIALAIEAGREIKQRPETVDSLAGILEALPLARHWKTLGLVPLEIHQAASDAMRGHSGYSSDSISQYSFERAFRPSDDESRLERYWLDLRKALTKFGVSNPSLAGALVGAFREMQDNVLQHSGDPASGFCGFRITPIEFEVGVADSGVGLSAAFAELNPETNLDTSDLLESAVLQGRSRKPDTGRGTGFSTLLRAMRRLDATIRVRTDDVSLTLQPRGAAEYDAELRQEAKLRGFVVCARLDRISP